MNRRKTHELKPVSFPLSDQHQLHLVTYRRDFRPSPSVMGGKRQLHLNWQLGFQDLSLDKEAWCTLSPYSMAKVTLGCLKSKGDLRTGTQGGSMVGIKSELWVTASRETAESSRGREALKDFHCTQTPYGCPAHSC